MTTAPNTLDLLQIQQQSLVDSSKIEFLRSLQPTNNTVYGIKTRARDMDPSMN